ncbi:MAG: MFS transporter [Gemmatimonadetes bacterium]|nr:MFS transporter [Gemmatimonadota bacterium]
MVGLVMVLPLLPFYATDFGATASVVGVLISAFSIAQLVSAPAWGKLSDARGRRPAILAGLWLSAIAYVVFGLASSVAMLLLSRIVQGLGGGTIGVVQAYVADASRPEERTKALGWLSAVTSFGAVVGPALGSLLLDVGGRRAPGLASAALCILVSIFAWRFLRESRELRRSAAHPVPTIPVTGRAAIWSVLARSGEPAPRLIWIYAIAIGAFYGTTPTIPLLLTERFSGITARTIGYVVMYLGGMGVLVRAFLLGWIVDQMGEARLSRLGLVLLAAGLTLAAAARSYPVLWLSLTLMPLGTAFLFPCVTGLLSRVVPSGDRGLYLGVQQTFGGGSRVAFPIAAGVLMDHFGRATPFWVSGVMVLATLSLTGAMESYLGVRAEPAKT